LGIELEIESEGALAAWLGGNCEMGLNKISSARRKALVGQKFTERFQEPRGEERAQLHVVVFGAELANTTAMGHRRQLQGALLKGTCVEVFNRQLAVGMGWIQGTSVWQKATRVAAIAAVVVGVAGLRGSWREEVRWRSGCHGDRVAACEVVVLAAASVGFSQGILPVLIVDWRRAP